MRFNCNFSFDRLIKFLYKPTCSSSLGIIRALFGLMMVIDIPDERGLWNIDVRFGDPMRCQFPLFNWLSPLPFEFMGLVFGIMWLGALGICLGFYFHVSCLMFILPYWYLYLLDKTTWNNHSYLFGLIASLFTFTRANNSFSFDVILKPEVLKNEPVPLWNYLIIRFQFFLVYFYAGIKKFDPDWIGGYSMWSLSLHWVFDPFRLFLTNEEIDFCIIHVFGFIFDLTIGFFLLIDKTRPLAIVFLSIFHLMNSCMFHIGQFPFVCLVTTPIFCNYDWPDRLKIYIRRWVGKFNEEVENLESVARKNEKYCRITFRHRLTCSLLGFYVAVQIILPFSHFITNGYNNWTSGLYGYSWDMMVQNWYSNVAVIKIVDNQSKEEYFLDPEAWVDNTRYSRHGDMLIQYAHCLKKNLNILEKRNYHGKSSFKNISVYVDIWSSLNGRFQQRMFDPRKDLLKVDWSPFKKISWLMPLLLEFSSWRNDLTEVEKNVYNWSNRSDVIFVADFPGFYLENYIDSNFSNITLTVLGGIVNLEQYNKSSKSDMRNVTLFKGDSIKMKEGIYHKLYTISNEPSCYMYTFNNNNYEKLNDDSYGVSKHKQNILMESVNIRIEKFWKSIKMLKLSFEKLIFNHFVH